MPIQDSDRFLIEDTTGVSKKITASKLKQNLSANTYNNHKLLVNTPTYESRFVYAQNLQSSVSPTDFMMVERNDVTYKVTGQQVIDYFPSLPAGLSGPITESGVKNQLILQSNANLSDFVQGDALVMVDVDGNPTTYTPVSSTITNVVKASPANISLYVTDTTDLKYMEVGDVVQGFKSPVDYYVLIGTIVNPFLIQDTNVITKDGWKDKSNENVKYGKRPTKNLTNGRGLIYDFVFPAANILFTKFASGNAPVELWGSNTGLENSWTLAASAANVGKGSPIESGDVPYRYIIFWKTDTGGTSDSRNWGVSESILDNSVNITSINTSIPSVTVNGGSWTGSNGTSSGEAAKRETQITGTPKSGTGNFESSDPSSIDGPMVVLTNSNDDWVDNQNRLGTNFYIKVASTRTGLAVLRTKAINQAQAWDAASGYLANSLVTYNGNYWVAISSNYSNSPDTTDELDWLDLGAI